MFQTSQRLQSTLLLAELWGKGWSLRPEQDPRTMTYIGTITRAGMNFHYYRGDDGEIYFDDEPEGGKPEWM